MRLRVRCGRSKVLECIYGFYVRAIYFSTGVILGGALEGLLVKVTEVFRNPALTCDMVSHTTMSAGQVVLALGVAG
jgi:hypothetical protein